MEPGGIEPPSRDRRSGRFYVHSRRFHLDLRTTDDGLPPIQSQKSLTPLRCDAALGRALKFSRPTHRGRVGRARGRVRQPERSCQCWQLWFCPWFNEANGHLDTPRQDAAVRSKPIGPDCQRAVPLYRLPGGGLGENTRSLRVAAKRGLRVDVAIDDRPQNTSEHRITQSIYLRPSVPCPVLPDPGREMDYNGAIRPLGWPDSAAVRDSRLFLMKCPCVRGRRIEQTHQEKARRSCIPPALHSVLLFTEPLHHVNP